MSYKNANLLDYSHNRSIPFKESADELYDLINAFAARPELNAFFDYFDTAYNLPKSVVRQRVCQHIARSYSENKAAFKPRLKIKAVPKHLLQYGALLYALAFAKRKKKVKVFKLIIDDICSVIEFRRWKTLIDVVGKEQVLCRTDGISIDEDCSGYKLFNDSKFQNVNIVELLKSIKNELFFGIWVVLKASLKVKVNLFPVALRIIYSYLTYSSFFANHSALYLIQERHYNTDAVKNYLFKKAGGSARLQSKREYFRGIRISSIWILMSFILLARLGLRSSWNMAGGSDVHCPLDQCLWNITGFQMSQPSWIIITMFCILGLILWKK